MDPCIDPCMDPCIDPCIDSCFELEHGIRDRRVKKSTLCSGPKSAHGFRVESTPPKISPNGAPPGAKVETKNHHKTMKIKVPEAEILRTPIKIEKLSLWNRSRSGFIMNFEFHTFLEKNTPSPYTISLLVLVEK